MVIDLRAVALLRRTLARVEQKLAFLGGTERGTEGIIAMLTLNSLIRFSDLEKDEVRGVLASITPIWLQWKVAGQWLEEAIDNHSL